MGFKTLLRECCPPVVVRIGRRLIHARRTPPEMANGASQTKTIAHRVAGMLLLLPHDHALPFIQRTWPLYDTPLRLIADTLRQSAGGFRAIDIGANVADSAALINAGGATPVLCIEGDPAYFPFLEHNARVIGPQVVIDKCFVGERDGFISE